jgi:succinoglycan biosynthesis transport protein ExoP
MNASPDARLHPDHRGIVTKRIGITVLVSFLGLIAGGVIAFRTPNNQIASTTIETKADISELPVAKDSAAEADHGPKFAETQYQIIVSHEVLYPVIRHLDLQKKWSLDGTELPLEVAYARLRGMVQPPEIRPPDFIRISIYGTDGVEAGLLANAIAQEYVDQRAAHQQAAVEESVQQLRDEVQEDEGAVSTRFAQASRLRTEAGYLDPNPDSGDASLRPEEPTSENNQDKIIEVQANIATLNNRLGALDHIKSADPAQAASLLNLNDPVLEQKLPLYQNAVAEKTRLLSSGLGHNHPDVRAVQGQIDAIEEQVRQEITTIRKGLVARLAKAEGTLNTLLNAVANPPEQKRKQANAQYLEAKQRYDQARQAAEEAKARLDAATTDSTKLPKPATISQPAKVGPAPGGPNTLYLLLGAVAGLLLGAGLTFLFAALDTSIKTPREVEKRLGLRLLGVVPKRSHRQQQIESEDPEEEPYAILRANLDSARQRVAASVLAVLSAGPGEGKSTTAANLATVYAANEQQTLIIDAALRRPDQHKFFGIKNEVGLSDFLRGEKTFEEIIQQARTPNLFIVTSGPSSAQAVSLLSTEKLAELVEMAKEWFDLVIFDCPDMLDAKDASAIGALAEGSIIVARHRRFPRSKIISAKLVLETLGTKVLGLVLNRAYMKFHAKRTLPGLTVEKRTKVEFDVSELEAAANRIPGDEAY